MFIHKKANLERENYSPKITNGRVGIIHFLYNHKLLKLKRTFNVPENILSAINVLVYLIYTWWSRYYNYSILNMRKLWYRRLNNLHKVMKLTNCQAKIQTQILSIYFSSRFFNNYIISHSYLLNKLGFSIIFIAEYHILW